MTPLLVINGTLKLGDSSILGEFCSPLDATSVSDSDRSPWAPVDQCGDESCFCSPSHFLREKPLNGIALFSPLASSSNTNYARCIPGGVLPYKRLMRMCR